MRQSPTMSLVEAITNVVVGYAVAVLTQLVVFPMFGLEVAFGEHLAIGLVFVGISLIRSYLLRRLFEVVRTPGYLVSGMKVGAACRTARCAVMVLGTGHLR